MKRSRAHSADSVPDVVPLLSSGRHRTAKQGACFMELAAFMAGERWSDHPQCTHPVLAALARDVNDLLTDDARDRLLPQVNRVIGLNSSDVRLSVTIAVRAAAAAIPIASLERQRALGAGLLSILESYSTPHLKQLAAEAFEQAPDARTWGSAYLATQRAHGTIAARAIAIVHTAAVGVANACVADADDRLVAMLDDAISETEALLAPHQTAPSPERETVSFR